MTDGMEEALRLTQVQGAAAMGVYICFFLFLSLSVLVFSVNLLLFDLSIFIYISAGTKWLWGGSSAM